MFPLNDLSNDIIVYLLPFLLDGPKRPQGNDKGRRTHLTNFSMSCSRFRQLAVPLLFHWCDAHRIVQSQTQTAATSTELDRVVQVISDVAIPEVVAKSVR